MTEILGMRPAAVAREMTKRFEDVRRGGLADLAAYYKAAGPPKGEIAVVIGPPEAAAAATSADDVERRLDRALETMSLRDAAEAVARATGLARREVYARALERAGRRRERE
jgi:16S rRNA (cytidine1402-2'-O)-methyltransferase